MPRRVVAVAAAGVLAVAAGVTAVVLTRSDQPAPRADAIPFDGRSPRAPGGSDVRVLVALSRPSLGQVVARAHQRLSGAEQAAYVRSLEREGFALRGSLRARGIALRHVMSFARTWNGFAATARARDLPQLQTFGLRVLRVRRFYPAADHVLRLGAPLEMPPAPPAGRRPVALLDSGVDGAAAALRGRLDAGWDLVEDRRGSSPGRLGRRVEEHGTELAGVLALAGERVLPLRIASLERDSATGAVEEVATTDTLLAGLERAVDLNGDGDTADHLPVALVGVNAPYAGFADAPEARAATGAAALGTLVVAPAGNQGAAAGTAGTVGSPAAAPATLAVGAAEGVGEPTLPRVQVAPVGEDPVWAALLGGPAPVDSLPTRPLAGAAAASGGGAGATGGTRAGGLAVLRRGADPAAQAAAAAGAGAAAVLLADPARRALLPAVPRDRTGVPVLGVTGGPARTLLRTLKGGTAVRFGDRRLSRAAGPARVSPFSAQGPALAGEVKPDLVAPGAALTTLAGGSTGLVSGTSVAAARAAAQAARLARAPAPQTPAQLAATLTAAARPLFAVRAAGAGLLAAPSGAARGLRASSRTLSLPARPARRGWSAHATVAITNPGTAPRTLSVTASATPALLAQVSPRRFTLPPGATRHVTLRLRAPAIGHPGLVTGRLTARGLSVPFALPVGLGAKPSIGTLRLTRAGTQVDGVRFPAGHFRRGDPAGAGTDLSAVGRLTLELVGAAGNTVELLTPPGGAPDLLPGEYAYTLPANDLAGLPAGTYRFRARAWPVARGPSTTRLSAPFTVP